MFAQIFKPPFRFGDGAERRLTRIDAWLRLSATALPQMPYISYFIAPVRADGTPDTDNPLQCAVLRPKNRRGGKFVKCGVSAKELPINAAVVPSATAAASGGESSSSGGGGGESADWQPMKLYLDPEEAQLTAGKQYALVLQNCPLGTCYISKSATATAPHSPEQGYLSGAAAVQYPRSPL